MFPGVLAVLCAVYLSCRLRDTPQSVGLPPIEEYRNEYPGQRRTQPRSGTGHPRVAGQLHPEEPLSLAVRGREFLCLSRRYSMLDWGPTYLKEVKHASLEQGGIQHRDLRVGRHVQHPADGLAVRQGRGPPRHDQRALHGSRFSGVRRHSVCAARACCGSI